MLYWGKKVRLTVILKKKPSERKKVICFHCERLENADKFSCLGLSYTETSCRLLNTACIPTWSRYAILEPSSKVSSERFSSFNIALYCEKSCCYLASLSAVEFHTLSTSSNNPV